jgi:poly-gamma-glutamate capsule biosynthesis protein CapA/YwtB (metallophosphatase superfamily)
MFNMPVEYLRGIIAASGAPPDRWALTLANNHVADVGARGPEVTCQRLRSIGVTPLGHRAQGDEHPLHVVRRHGLRLGLAAWTQWLNVDRFAPGDARVWRLPEVVDLPWRRLREEHGLDALIGSTHWEYEWQHFPRKETRALAGALHRAGFDLLVGSHQHVLQSFERHAHGLTLYGMGNFCSGLGRAWPARMTSVAEIELGTRGADRGRVVAYQLHLFAQVNGGERIQLLPLERVPLPLRRRIRQRASKLFEVEPQYSSSSCGPEGAETSRYALRSSERISRGSAGGACGLRSSSGEKLSTSPPSSSNTAQSSRSGPPGVTA